MRVVVAPDKFAGSMSAAEAARAITDGWLTSMPDDRIVQVPVADGGEGFVETLAATVDAQRHTVVVRDPLGRPVPADFLLLTDSTALVEAASACGLRLLAPGDRDPRVTTTAGVGDLLLAALDSGARRLVVGMGGSATNDGGAGCLQALGVRLLDADGAELRPGGAALARIDEVDAAGLDPRLADVDVVLASDVDNPLLGPAGATHVFGPQKGADAAAVAELELALTAWAQSIPYVALRPGSGAAGGLGAGLMAYAGATMRPGIDVVAELTGLRRQIATADVVVTGEGRLDAQSLRGKAPFGVAAIAQDAGVPCVVLAGQVEVGRRELAAAGFSAAYAVADIAPSLEEAIADGVLWLAELARAVAREWSRR